MDAIPEGDGEAYAEKWDETENDSAEGRLFRQCHFAIVECAGAETR